jgi:hypothetical protein
MNSYHRLLLTVIGALALGAGACSSGGSGSGVKSPAQGGSVAATGQSAVASSAAASAPAPAASATRSALAVGAPAGQAPLAARAVDPCKLVTQAEAEASISQLLAPGVDSSGAHLECRYQDATKDHSVRVEVSPPNMPPAAVKGTFNAARSKPGDGNEKSEDVPGIGDAAFYARTTVKDELGVLVGDRYYVIRFDPAGVADAKAKLTSLAKQALTRR